MRRIFVSYRREDTRLQAQWLRYLLSQQFGRESVFLDVDGIPSGADFRKHIKHQLRECRVVVALFGELWAGKSTDGNRRIDAPDDWFRIEIETALERNIPVIPVVVEETQFPKSDELPPTLRPLVVRQLARLRAGKDLEHDTTTIIKDINTLIGPTTVLNEYLESAVRRAQSASARVSSFVRHLQSTVIGTEDSLPVDTTEELERGSSSIGQLISSLFTSTAPTVDRDQAASHALNKTKPAVNVAVVGTDGTGKTVLMTILAQTFKREQEGVALIPLTRPTSLYVASMWDYLREGVWPPSTLGGHLSELLWELRIDGVPKCNLRFIDLGGENFRRLFGMEEVQLADALPAPMKIVLEYMKSSHVVVTLVNLANFIDEKDSDKRQESEWAVKNALDWLKLAEHPRECAVVFTQSDRYETVFQRFGSWQRVAQRYLPHVYEAYVRNGPALVHAVSAVSRTREIVLANGETQYVPEKKWYACGLATLMKWVGLAATEPSNQIRYPLKPDGGDIGSVVRHHAKLAGQQGDPSRAFNRFDEMVRTKTAELTSHPQLFWICCGLLAVLFFIIFLAAHK
jgi:TIR domain